MASRIITANYPRVVRYLPNLDAAVRHFTSFLPHDSPIHSSSGRDLGGVDGGLNPAPAPSRMRFENINLMTFDSLSQQLRSGVSVDLSVLDQFGPGAEKMANITPTVMDSLECVAQPCPNVLKKELKALFPGNERFVHDGATSDVNVTVITLSQHTQNDMSGWSQAVEEERDQLLDKFMSAAKEICYALKMAGYWADFIEPSSGLPYHGEHTNTMLYETDESYKSLGFDIDDLGCCRVIRHKRWGTHAYVGSLFTDAPMDLPVIQNLVQE